MKSMQLELSLQDREEAPSLNTCRRQGSLFFSVLSENFRMGSSSSAEKEADKGGQRGTAGTSKGQGARGGVAAAPPLLSDTDKAVLDIKRQQGRLIKTRVRLEGDVKHLVQAATKLKTAGQNERAITLLKLRRSKAREVQLLEANLAKLEELKTSVQVQLQQAQVLLVLQEGTKALESMRAAMPLELADTILEDSAAAIEAEQQVAQLLSGSAFSAADEDELDEEFAALGVEAPPTAAPAAPAAPADPADPAAPAAPAAAAVSMATGVGNMMPEAPKSAPAPVLPPVEVPARKEGSRLQREAALA